MLNSLLVGIDVSLKDNKVRILHPDGTSLLKFTVLNSVPGATILSQKVTGVMEKTGFDSLVIGLESTSVYGDPLVYFLRLSKEYLVLATVSCRIFSLMPESIRRKR